MIFVKDIDVILKSTAPLPNSKHELIRKRSLISITLFILTSHKDENDRNDSAIALFKFRQVEDILMALPGVVPATELDPVLESTSSTANSRTWVLSITSLGIVGLIGVSAQGCKAIVGEAFEVPTLIFGMSDMMIRVNLSKVFQKSEDGIDTSTTVVFTVSLVRHLVLFRIHDGWKSEDRQKV